MIIIIVILNFDTATENPIGINVLLDKKSNLWYYHRYVKLFYISTGIVMR